ncbi:MAG: Acetyltransferase, family protein [Labilithrix sp.]|nr:Acetyltransferase, family protein [Labilithrix sp.]
MPTSSRPPPPRVRAATGADHEVFTRLFPELAVDDPILDRAQFERDLLPSTLIAETEEGEVLGYTYFDVVKDVAYVRHLVSGPDVRRSGVGRALLEAIAAQARQAGCTTWCLNVKPDNTAAIALYEKVGMTSRYTSRALEIAWEHVQDAPTPASGDGVRARPIEPEDDRALERELRLLDGQLAEARKNAGRVLHMLERATGEPLGATIFNPDFPGAYPFRVAHCEHAPLLLRALMPFRRPHHGSLNVVTENQADVADHLVGLGARVKLDIVHMKGALPDV